jgi:hypothetical protein
MQKPFKLGRFWNRGLGPSVRGAAPASPAIDSPPLAWAPSCPDQTDLRPRGLAAAVVPFIAAVFAISQWAVPANAWAGVYPDSVPSAPSVHASQQQAVAHNVGLTPQPAPTLAPLSWAPVYPERIPAQPGVLAAQQQTVAHAIGSRSSLPVVSSAWAPTLPERVRLASSVGAEGQQFSAFAIGSRSSLPPTALSWKPGYPDAIACLTIGAPHQQALAYVPAVSAWAIPALSWAPSFPERAASPPPRLEGGESVVLLVAQAPTAPSLSWKPIAPDFAPGAVRLVAHQQAFFAPQALAQLKPPSLAWSPTYPDRAPGLSLLVSCQQAIAYTPARAQWGVPSQSWSPSYPDRALSGSSLHASAQPPLAYVPARAHWRVLSTSWASTFADAVPARTSNQQPTFVLVIPLALKAPTLSWAPDFPDRAPGPPAHPEQRQSLALVSLTSQPWPYGQEVRLTSARMQGTALVDANARQATAALPLLVASTLASIAFTYASLERVAMRSATASSPRLRASTLVNVRIVGES